MRRWVLISWDRGGREIDRRRFWLRSSADRECRLQDGWARISAIAGHGPLYTNEVRKVGGSE